MFYTLKIYISLDCRFKTIFSLNLAENYQPVMSYIKPQITPPSPLKVAIQNGDLQRRIILAAFGSPRGKPARNTRHLTWRVGRGTLA
jgi:hypothetical protein